MQDDFRDWLNENDNPPPPEIVRQVGMTAEPLVEAFTVLKLSHNSMFEDIFIAIISGIVVANTDTFDNAYAMLGKIKEIIIEKEKEFNKQG